MTKSPTRPPIKSLSSIAVVGSYMTLIAFRIVAKFSVILNRDVFRFLLLFVCPAPTVELVELSEFSELFDSFFESIVSFFKLTKKMSTSLSSSSSNNVVSCKGEDHHSFLSAEDIKLFDEWDRLSALYANAKKTKTLPTFVKSTSNKRKLDTDQPANAVAAS